MTHFAKISINEIQKLNAAKASGLEIIIYQAIAAHIFSNTRKNAYPSLLRIQKIIGGIQSIQSITRAINGLVKKGLLEKGKVRTRKRFVLIHRPIKKITEQAKKHAQSFLKRFQALPYSRVPGHLKSSQVPVNISSPNQITDTKPFRLPKRDNEVENSKSLIEERGRRLWFRIAPTATRKFSICKLTVDEKTIFTNWVTQGDTQEKKWILERHNDDIVKQMEEIS